MKTKELTLVSQKNTMVSCPTVNGAENTVNTGIREEKEALILPHFEGVTDYGAHQFGALCPVHGDSKPSLSLKFLDDGKILTMCHAGCEFKDIVAAAGLKPADFFPPKGKWHVADYDYLTKYGKPLVRVSRWQPKSFSRCRPDGQGGWLPGGTGNIAALYRWPELAQACVAHATAYLVEGEKDADALTAAGAVATTCLGGAGGWRDEFADEFVGLSKVVIISDRDTSRNGFKGQHFAEAARKAIEAKGIPVQALVLPKKMGDRWVKDAADFLIDGRTLRDLEEAVAAAPAWDEYYALLGTLHGAVKDIYENDSIPSRKFPVLVANRVNRWLKENGHFLKWDGQLSYLHDATGKLFDTRSGEWLAWLFYQLESVSQTGSVGQEIKQRFSLNPTALADPDTVACQPANYWTAIKANGEVLAVCISNGTGFYRITADGIEAKRQGEDGIIFASALESWKLVEQQDALDPLTLSVFADMACDDHAKRLFLLFLLSLPFCQPRKPALCLCGDVGSGKTFAVQAAQRLLGLPAQSLIPNKNNQRDFWPLANGGGLCLLDNVDSLVPWLANELDVAATGSGQSSRVLFTNSEIVYFRPNAGIALTSADPTFAGRSSTADRLLAIEFHTRTERRAKDGELLAPLAANRDRLMSFMAYAIRDALRQPRPFDGINSRHPDFGILVQRLGAALGYTDVPDILREEEVIKKFLPIRHDSRLLGPLYDFMRGREGPWDGTLGALVDEMTSAGMFSEEERQRFSAPALGKAIHKAWSQMQAVFNAEKRGVGHGQTTYIFQPPAA